MEANKHWFTGWLPELLSPSFHSFATRFVVTAAAAPALASSDKWERSVSFHHWLG